jgi:DNA-binding MarR family transcriptional regulator
MEPMTPTAQTTRPKPDTAELASRLRMVVARLARRLRREEPSGLSQSLLSALATVERHGPLTVGALAATEQVAPPSMTRAVGALAEAGLVERVPDPDDRRVAWVATTDEGKTLLRRSRRVRDAYLLAHLRKATPEELAVLERAAEILERLVGGST